MMWLKRGLLLLLVVGMLTGLMGCKIKTPDATVPKVPAATEDPVKAAYKSNRAGFVEFSRSTEPREWYVPISELLEYETQFPDCNSTWYRDQLSGEDLIIYNSYLYALENRYIGFTVYVEDSDKDFSYIREMVSLDSPFLEQNYTHYEYISKRPINYVGKRIHVSMEQFTDNRWDMKMEALDKCRQIVQNIPPAYQTQQAKMEYLYDYVCHSVEYVNYESMADESFFYDAVCKGETLCDGYSNMLLLLFRMIGVECCEVMAYGEKGESGHTWVVAKLDGVFYNFDPTFEDTSTIQTTQRKYFGFSDGLVSMNTLEYEQMRPKCTDTSRDFIYADITVDSLTDWDAVEMIMTLAEKNLDAGVNITLIGVKRSVDSEAFDLFFDRFPTYITRSVEISATGWHMRNGTLIELTLIEK